MARRSNFSSVETRGFTLVEVLLVLALLVVLGSISAVTLSGTLGVTNLTQSGETIRAALTKAKLRAIELGQPVLFRGCIGTGDWKVESAGEALTALATPADTGGGTATSTAPVMDVATPVAAVTGTLEEDIVFRQIVCSTVDGLPLVEVTGATADGQWSAPVVFMPNGTAYNADMLIARLDADGNDDRWLKIALRGLTCTSTSEQVDQGTLEPTDTATSVVGAGG